MKLGVVSSIWEWAGLSPFVGADRAASLGFKYVDVLAYGNAHPTKIKGTARKELAQKFRDLGLVACNMVTLPPNISLSDVRERQRQMDYLADCAEFQAELGGRQICLGMGGGSLELDLGRERAWVNSVEFIREFAERLAKMKMLLTLEFDPFYFSVIQDTTTQEKIIAEVDMGNVFANVDLGHLAMTREPAGAMKKLKGTILHVHISDNDGETHSNSIIGTGVTAVADYMKALEEEMQVEETCEQQGEPAVVVLELGEAGQDIKDPDSYVTKSLEYVKRNVPGLTK